MPSPLHMTDMSGRDYNVKFGLRNEYRLGIIVIFCSLSRIEFIEIMIFK
jgi:hypothetical protein